MARPSSARPRICRFTWLQIHPYYWFWPEVVPPVRPSSNRGDSVGSTFFFWPEAVTPESTSDRSPEAAVPLRPSSHRGEDSQIHPFTNPPRARIRKFSRLQIHQYYGVGQMWSPRCGRAQIAATQLGRTFVSGPRRSQPSRFLRLRQHRCPNQRATARPRRPPHCG